MACGWLAQAVNRHQKNPVVSPGAEAYDLVSAGYARMQGPP